MGKKNRTPEPYTELAVLMESSEAWCPNCRSSNLMIVDDDDGNPTAEVSCIDCGEIVSLDRVMENAADTERTGGCVRACRNIPDPEKTIPALVEALRNAEANLTLYAVHTKGGIPQPDHDKLPPCLDTAREAIRTALSGVKEASNG